MQLSVVGTYSHGTPSFKMNFSICPLNSKEVAIPSSPQAPMKAGLKVVGVAVVK
jgi:hypothetical protein